MKNYAWVILTCMLVAGTAVAAEPRQPTCVEALEYCQVAPGHPFSLVPAPDRDVRVDLAAALGMESSRELGYRGGGGGSKNYIAPGWLAGEPNKATWITTGVLGAGVVALAIDDDVETIENVGDATQIVPAVAGLGMSLGAKDWKGSLQFLYSGLLSTTVVHLGKEAAQKDRPDGSNTQSFPSGHTQASFWGAGFIMQRYGPKWGIPALLMASYTGTSRIYAQKHFTDDVISGMSIALFSNFLLVDPADPDRAARQKDMDRRRKFRFEWETANGDVGRNLVQSPADTGTVIDFRFNSTNNPQRTASIAFSYMATERHGVSFRYTPFEVRDLATLAEDTTFGDSTFLAGTSVVSAYFFGDLRSRYEFVVFPESNFIVDVGGGLTWLDTTAELAPATGSGEDLEVDLDARETQYQAGFLPTIYTRVGYDFSKLIRLFVEADYINVSEDEFLDFAAKLEFHINSKWDVGVGWREVRTKLDVDDMRNDFLRTGFLVHVGYSF